MTNFNPLPYCNKTSLEDSDFLFSVLCGSAKVCDFLNIESALSFLNSISKMYPEYKYSIKTI